MAAASLGAPTPAPAQPRKIQGESYSGPITLSEYEKFETVRELLAKEGIKLPIPTGN